MSYRLEIGFALLLALAIAIALWAASRTPSPPTFDPRASTYLTGPRGSKGLYDVLTRLGVPSERRRTPLLRLTTERARRPAVLVLLDPFIPLQDAEVEQVVRYVRAGGAVLATGYGGGVTRCAGWRVQPEGFSDDSFEVRVPAPDVRLPRTRHLLTAWTADRVESDKSDVEEVVTGSNESAQLCRSLVPYAIDTVVATLSARPVIVRLRYRSGGSVTLVAEDDWFRNRAWRDSDVPVVAVPLLTPRGDRSGRVVWDEYHQGFGAAAAASVSGRTLSWLRSSPAGWAILQLIAVALLWLAMTAVRFGPARPAVERRRRSPLEHLEALGAGLESAADADTAVNRLALGLRRRLSRTGQLGQGDVVPWIEGLELAMRGPTGRAAVRRLHQLLTVRGREAEPASARVLHAAQAVEDVWEELRPRTTRNAS